MEESAHLLGVYTYVDRTTKAGVWGMEIPRTLTLPFYVFIVYIMTNNQIVQVNIKTNEEKKKKRRKKTKYAKRRNTQNAGLQASAYQQPAAPNRPYMPLTNYIASPYNNGLVPEVFTIKELAQQTLSDMKKYMINQFEYDEKQTTKIEEIKDVIKQTMSTHGSHIPSTHNPHPSSNEYSQYPTPPSSAYDELASQRSVASQTSVQSQKSVASQSSVPSSFMLQFKRSLNID